MLLRFGWVSPNLFTHCIDLIIFVTCNIYPAAVNRKKKDVYILIYLSYVFVCYINIIFLVLFSYSPNNIYDVFYVLFFLGSRLFILRNFEQKLRLVRILILDHDLHAYMLLKLEKEKQWKSELKFAKLYYVW